MWSQGQLLRTPFVGEDATDYSALRNALCFDNSKIGSSRIDPLVIMLYMIMNNSCTTLQPFCSIDNQSSHTFCLNGNVGSLVDWRG